MPNFRLPGTVIIGLLFSLSSSAASAPITLTVKGADSAAVESHQLDLGKLRSASKVETVIEPHEKKSVQFRAIAAEQIFAELGVKERVDKSPYVTFVCADGYRSTVLTERFKSGRAYFAFERIGGPFEIHKEGKRVSIKPLYLVWTPSPDVKKHGASGWPYQVTGIELP